MGEFFDWLFNSDEVSTVVGLTLIFGIGAFFYIMNWVIFFNNLNPKKKWSSMVPPLGGLLIAVGILLIGGGWWALVGLTDACVWLILYSLLRCLIPHNKKTQQTSDDMKEKDENGKQD